MSALPYTKKLLIQRIRKDVSNSRFVKDEFAASDNEINLYIDQAAAAKIVGSAYANAKIDGALAVNEAYLITYSFDTIYQDDTTSYWYVTLPQPPIGLPLGYSVNRAYFAATGLGVSQELFPIKAKRVGYRLNMPLLGGTRYWIENNRMWMQSSSGQPLLGLKLFVQMPSARTTDVNAVMNMPEDDIEFVFNDVVKQLMRRYGVPQDTIKDDLPAGNKSS